jgi:hypothetical protein
VAKIHADPRGLGSPSELSSAALVGLSSTSSRGIRRCWPPRPRLSPQPETRTPHPSTDPSAEAMGDCRRASTPADVAACFGSRETISGVTFRPRGFAPPRRFPPLGGCGLVASRCRSWGSLRFGSLRPRARRPASRSAVGGGHVVLAARFIPLEESSVAAAPRHRGRCPLAVGFRTGQTLRHPPLPMNISEPHLYGASTSGRCSAAESGHVPDRCRSEPHPVLPWALFPFEVLPLS